MTHFEYCVRNPQKHGSYMPFARVLGLSGATQNEPSLSAIALGVSSVYQSAVCWLGWTLTLDIKLWQQQLIRSSGQKQQQTGAGMVWGIQLELQSIHNKRETAQDKDLTSEEHEVPFTFSQRSERIHQRQCEDKARWSFSKRLPTGKWNWI